jgi:transcriptional regulator with XRE-family HTH domain
MDFSGNQLRAARALLEIGQEALAEKAGVSDNTIRNMEACGPEIVGGFASTRNKVREALETMGIRFTNGDAPGVIWSRKGGKAARNTEGDRTMTSKKQASRSKPPAAAGRKPYPVPPAKGTKPGQPKRPK